MLILVLYVLQTIYSFYMFQRTLRIDFDLTVGDLIFVSVLSLIPTSFASATVVFLLRHPFDFASKIVVKRYEK